MEIEIGEKMWKLVEKGEVYGAQNRENGEYWDKCLTVWQYLRGMMVRRRLSTCHPEDGLRLS